jgi:Domain of unknown function (DUF4258)
MPSGPKRPATVVNIFGTLAWARRVIQEIAQDTSRIDWSVHAQERMEEREITDADVLAILRQGDIAAAPQRNERGEWECEVVHRLRGARDAGVVTIIMTDPTLFGEHARLFIKTVMWKDWRG